MKMIFHLMKVVGRLLPLLGTVALLAACGSGGSAQTQIPTATTGFHTTLKTTDGQFVIQFAVTPNRLGLNVFTIEVQDASNAKAVPGLRVQLTTTMLDMDMGTDEMNLPSVGNGQYSAQGTLSMAGRWEIGILLRTQGTDLHKATVELDTAAFSENQIEASPIPTHEIPG